MAKTITVRKFELNEKVRRFTEPKELKKIRAVVQTKNKVYSQIIGLEPWIHMYLWRSMKKNQFALVFDEKTQRLLGYVSKDENGIPQRYKETEELYFKDMYEEVEE